MADEDTSNYKGSGLSRKEYEQRRKNWEQKTSETTILTEGTKAKGTYSTGQAYTQVPTESGTVTTPVTPPTMESRIKETLEKQGKTVTTTDGTIKAVGEGRQTIITSSGDIVVAPVSATVQPSMLANITEARPKAKAEEPMVSYLSAEEMKKLEAKKETPNWKEDVYNTFGQRIEESQQTRAYIEQQKRLGRPLTWGEQRAGVAASLSYVGLRATRGFVTPFLKPVETAKGLYTLVRHPIQSGKEIILGFKEEPIGYSAEFYGGAKALGIIGRTAKPIIVKSVKYVGKQYLSSVDPFLKNSKQLYSKVTVSPKVPKYQSSIIIRFDKTQVPSMFEEGTVVRGKTPDPLQYRLGYEFKLEQLKPAIFSKTDVAPFRVEPIKPSLDFIRQKRIEAKQEARAEAREQTIADIRAGIITEVPRASIRKILRKDILAKTEVPPPFDFRSLEQPKYPSMSENYLLQKGREIKARERAEAKIEAKRGEQPVTLDMSRKVRAAYRRGVLLREGHGLLPKRQPAEFTGFVRYVSEDGKVTDIVENKVILEVIKPKKKIIPLYPKTEEKASQKGYTVPAPEIKEYETGKGQILLLEKPKLKTETKGLTIKKLVEEQKAKTESRLKQNVITEFKYERPTIAKLEGRFKIRPIVVPVLSNVSRTSLRVGTDQRSSLSTVQESASKIKVDTALELKSLQANMSKMAIGSAIKSKVESKIKLDYKQESRQELKQLQYSLPKKFVRPDYERESEFRMRPSYNIVVGIGKQAKTIGTGLPLGKALKLGSSETLRTLRATFRLKESGVTSAEDIPFNVPEKFFREYKIRQGQRVATPLQFIQKRGTRLSTQTERQEIKLARMMPNAS